MSSPPSASAPRILDPPVATHLPARSNTSTPLMTPRPPNWRRADPSKQHQENQVRTPNLCSGSDKQQAPPSNDAKPDTPEAAAGSSAQRPTRIDTVFNTSSNNSSARPEYLIHNLQLWGPHHPSPWLARHAPGFGSPVTGGLQAGTIKTLPATARCPLCAATRTRSSVRIGHTAPNKRRRVRPRLTSRPASPDPPKTTTKHHLPSSGSTLSS
jgi:hypothetical protein